MIAGLLPLKIQQTIWRSNMKNSSLHNTGGKQKTDHTVFGVLGYFFEIEGAGRCYFHPPLPLPHKHRATCARQSCIDTCSFGAQFTTNFIKAVSISYQANACTTATICPIAHPQPLLHNRVQPHPVIAKLIFVPPNLVHGLQMPQGFGGTQPGTSGPKQILLTPCTPPKFPIRHTIVGLPVSQ